MKFSENAAGKRIALIEWRWDGHHPTFYSYLVLALEELGAEVLAVCPDPQAAQAMVERLRRDRGSTAHKGSTSYRQVQVFKKRFYWNFLKRLSTVTWTLFHFRSIDKIVKRWQDESGKKVDLVFYACIHEWEFDALHYVQPILSFPWAGLYLHALSIRRPGQKTHTGRIPRPEKIFQGSQCKAVVTFDEGIVSQLKEVTGKPVVAFPDFTDERMPQQSGITHLDNRLKRFADGRPVVGIFGFLLRTKGVYPLALVSRHSKMSEVCFAFAGEMSWSTYPANEIDTICDILTDGANTWTHLMRIPKEEQLNSLISACDILSAAYLDFSSSSNILAKAALLKKPVIVSDGYLMAERVRRFRMGEIIPQGDVEAQVQAIKRIIGDPEAWLEKNQPDWAGYLREHSFENLKESFCQVIAQT